MNQTDKRAFEALLDHFAMCERAMQITSMNEPCFAARREELNEARAAVLQAYEEAAGREGHGIMPANLAHKLKAFAAEPEGTINWKMIAWSLHRMLNAKPFTHPAPKPDAAADCPTIYQVAQARIAELHCALTNLYALVQGECPSLLENDHHDEMIRKALTGEQR